MGSGWDCWLEMRLALMRGVDNGLFWMHRVVVVRGGGPRHPQGLLDQSQASLHIWENATYPPILGLFGPIRVPYPKGLDC